MFELVRREILRVFKVPHDPDPPAGAPGSLRVFRAGTNYYKLRLLRWGFGQLGALAGIIFSLLVLHEIERVVEAARTPPPPSRPAETQTVAPASPESAPKTVSKKSSGKARPSAQDRARSSLQRLAERWPSWLVPLITLFELGGIIVYLVQIPITYAMARLDYELRWYMVTDRSLRIRAGLAAVQESTMSFANIQQVVVTQGPLQRLLGLADVRVQSAGGGGGGEHHKREGAGDSLHMGVFHGVENAPQIRDLILERLRRYRQTGLGDPDDAPTPATVPPFPTPLAVSESAAVTAARELLQEARALRATLR